MKIKTVKYLELETKATIPLTNISVICRPGQAKSLNRKP